MVAWLAVGLCLLSAGLALVSDLSSITWTGGATDYSGKKVYNGIITRAQLYKDDIFLCIPRLKEGIESTLVRGNIKDRQNGILEPYPSWKPQTEGDCSCLQSAVDIFLDPTAVLWVLDTGATHLIQPQPLHSCPPKIVAIDVTSGRIDKVISLSGLTSPESRLQFIIADYSVEGESFVYISDAGTGSIIVYDVGAGKGYKAPLPPAAVPKVQDVLYITLVRKPSGENFLYFTYRDSEELYSISTKILQGEKSCTKASAVGKKPGKLIFLGTDDWENQYLRFENKTEVYKWDSSTPFTESNFKVVDHGRSGLIPTHAVTDYKRGVMRLMESNLVTFLHGGAKQEEAVNCLKVMQLDN